MPDKLAETLIELGDIYTAMGEMVAKTDAAAYSATAAAKAG